jgi:tRNA (cmo5U34)-methyltransferase
MEDPIRSHPTRAEQLDILATVITDTLPEGGWFLDLGIGTGFVAHLILSARPDLGLVGVDIKPESLAAARDNLPAGGERLFVEGDLTQPDAIDLPHAGFDGAISALTFHDLGDDAKQAVIGRAAEALAPGGVFLLYDRIRLTEPRTFALQRSLWRRIERKFGRAMREAADFAAYQADLADNNRPATLDNYFTWFKAAGLGAQLLHLHGNVMLMAGVKAAG